MSKFPKFLVVIIIGLIVVATLYHTYRYLKTNIQITRGSAANLEKPSWIKTAKEAREAMATVVPAPKPDITVDGSLRLRNKGEENESWTLLYEEPGKPAALAYLIFNFRSQCDFGKGEGICNTKKFENGLRVHLEGNKSGNDVTVIKLNMLE